MDGNGHRMLAPVFTACTGTVLSSFDLLGDTPNIPVTIAVMSMLSVASARWCDADLLALKPTPIITGTAKKTFSKKYNKEFYYVVMSEKDFNDKYNTKKKRNDVKHEVTKTKKYVVYYEHCKKEPAIMLAWAMLFKAMNLKEHRGWQSHSLPLWILIWSGLSIASYNLSKLPISYAGIIVFLLAGIIAVKGINNNKKFKIKINPLTISFTIAIIVIFIFSFESIYKYLYILVASLGLGYVSHIVGDAFTTEGAPILADNKLTRALKRIPILGKLVITDFKPMSLKIGKWKVFKFAKASNKNYVYVVMVIFVVIAFAFLNPKLFISSFISITKTIWSGIVNIFTFLFELLRA